ATYYFRAHFVLTRLVQGSSLAFSGYVDDGAIFYLNGAEIQRLRMPNSSDSQVLASGFPCDGDATCLDEFKVPSDSINNLVPGDNVLAVEVHNYNARSGDITFGVALDLIEPISRAPRLEIKSSGNVLTLSWEAGGYILQSTDAPHGPWKDVPGLVQSPFEYVPLSAGQYFRLRK
ncbi:MAG: hypothetical protein L0387_25495, partial [Acidobacteria bacterium]|nr:hypothetical protein [Acidobacteriota bacterium]